MADHTVSEIATYFRVCDGTRVRYADTKADSDTVILMLAPWPETLWAYRRVWDQIRAVGRVVALDMPGFGHSDQPERLIAPDAMGDFLALLIDEWDLGAPHIVGPDVGTAAALFLAKKAPEKIASLSIGGGAVTSPLAAGGALEAVVRAPSLDDVRQLDARVNISAAVESAAPQGTEPYVHEDYVSAYDLGRFAESARFVRHYPEQNKVVQEFLPSIQNPCSDPRRRTRRPRAVVEQPVLGGHHAQQRGPPSRCWSLCMGGSGRRVRAPRLGVDRRGVQEVRRQLSPTSGSREGADQPEDRNRWRARRPKVGLK